jgi:LytS/YehU family sensor histidine kinase
MNPHFIFNSLNSINNFILKNESEQASEFLTKFSRLVRQVLQTPVINW